jgi:hypothetical protein
VSRPIRCKTVRAGRTTLDENEESQIANGVLEEAALKKGERKELGIERSSKTRIPNHVGIRREVGRGPLKSKVGQKKNCVSESGNSD